MEGAHSASVLRGPVVGPASPLWTRDALSLDLSAAEGASHVLGFLCQIIRANNAFPFSFFPLSLLAVLLL